MKNILARFEGGVGDCLLANRFLLAIKEKYKDSNIKVAFDTGTNTYQESLLKSLWPSIYTDTYTIGEKLNNKYLTKNIDGETIDWINDPKNLPINFSKDIESSDLYFDLHIASLRFLRYDIPWKKYYYFFPEPESIKKFDKPLPKKFVLMHLYPRPDSFHSLDQEYALNLVKKVNEKIPVVVICEDKYKNWYKGCSDWIIDPSFEEIFYISSKCFMFFGADSAVRYVPLHYGKPSYVLSRHCIQPFSLHGVNLAHLCRWSIFRDKILPHNVDVELILKLISNYESYPGYYLFPEIGSDLDNILMDRRIK